MLSFDEWNVWYRTRRTVRVPGAAWLAGRAADPGGSLHGRGCAGVRRRPHLASQSRRPRALRLPRPARQRDRPDHDGDRRPGLAADDLLSLRPDEPLGARRRVARQGRVRDLRSGLLRSVHGRGRPVSGPAGGLSQARRRSRKKTAASRCSRSIATWIKR